MSVRERVLGVYDSGLPGPTLIALTALHGNEHAGIPAFERVLSVLERRRPSMRGRLVGVIGNLRALERGQRFIDRDLNRNWSDTDLRAAATRAKPLAEDLEQLDLLDAIRPYLREAQQPIVFVDLHTTSGEGIPFACAADVLRNRSVAFDLGIPVVLGLEEVIEGSLLGYLCDHGHIGVVVEAGQHESPTAADYHTSALWIALVSANLLRVGDVPDIDEHRHRLRTASSGVPCVVEIVHRRVVQPGDRFVMEPGYRSFTWVKKGEVLAHDDSGAVEAPERGLILMPRYQGQGDDGFFIARPVRRTWLRVSTVARRLLLDRTLRLLPGVEAHDRDALVVRGRAADLLAPEIFHLFGYRRSLASSSGTVFMRRQPDQVGLRLPPDLRHMS